MEQLTVQQLGANAKAVADGNYTIRASVNGKTGKKDLVVTAE